MKKYIITFCELVIYSPKLILCGLEGSAELYEPRVHVYDEHTVMEYENKTLLLKENR